MRTRLGRPYRGGAVVHKDGRVPPPNDPAQPGWHDRAVANAADAWLNEPRDVHVYQRLVDAIDRRRAWLHPTLGFAAPNDPIAPRSAQPELTDALAEHSPPVPLAQALAEARAGIEDAAQAAGGKPDRSAEQD